LGGQLGLGAGSSTLQCLPNDTCIAADIDSDLAPAVIISRDGGRSWFVEDLPVGEAVGTETI